jgi:hypothetical protein
MSAGGILRWGSLIVFIWSAVTGRWTVVLATGLVQLVLLAIDGFANIHSPTAMRGFWRNIGGGLLGGIAFSALAMGFPVLFLVTFHDWEPNISREALQLLISTPGLLLGISAWIAIYRYFQRRGSAEVGLTKDARRALGRVSPELFKLQLEDSLAHVLDEYYAAGQELVGFSQWGENLDLTDVLVAVGNTKPIRLANDMADANPQLPLRALATLPVLEPLKAVLRMLVGCDPFRSDNTDTQT